MNTKLYNFNNTWLLALKFLTILVVLLSLSSIFTKRVNALSWTYPLYNVDIEISKDSSFKVKETATFVFEGSLNGLRRDITLHDPERSQICADNGDFTCGGFEFLTIESVEVNGELLNDDEYKIYEIKDEYTQERSLRVEKRLYDEATYVTNETHTWTIEYTVYGGIQWMENSGGDEVPYFYWNVLPEDRGGLTANSRVTIKFPDNVVADYTKAYQYTNETPDFYVNEDQTGLILEGENYSSYTPITVSYEFKNTDLQRPASVKFESKEPYYGRKLYFDGGLLPEDFGDTFKYVPVGTHEFKVERFGYETVSEKLKLSSGDKETIFVDMTPHFWMQVLLSANNVLFGLGILFVPISIFYIYHKHKKQGIDENKAKTIIPLFNAPEDMKPYLIGSLVDEKVDKTDITGTIIDLAYRGFIHIKEIKKKKYELTRKSGNEGEKLDAVEEELLGIILDEGESVMIDSLTYSQINRIFNLKSKIYSEMVTRGYFKKNPETTRGIYLGLGITFIIFGVLLAIGGTIVVSGLLGHNTIMTSGVSLLALGLMMAIYSKYMPAKTKLGSQKHAEILGFRTYLNAAERYRLKDLKPEEFEKFLSYAVVLVVEKEWAKSFKDIYNQKPNWYEGNSNMLDAYFWSRWARDFNNSTTNHFTSTVRASGSHSSGSGWSGGGSFGGFSGGGGGGGSSGGW